MDRFEEILVKLAELHTDVKTIKTDIAEMKKNFRSLNGRIRTNEKDIASLKTSRKYLVAMISIVASTVALMINLLLKLMGV